MVSNRLIVTCPNYRSEYMSRLASYKHSVSLDSASVRLSDQSPQCGDLNDRNMAKIERIHLSPSLLHMGFLLDLNPCGRRHARFGDALSVKTNLGRTTRLDQHKYPKNGDVKVAFILTSP